MADGCGAALQLPRLDLRVGPDAQGGDRSGLHDAQDRQPVALVGIVGKGRVGGWRKLRHQVPAAAVKLGPKAASKLRVTAGPVRSCPP
ncbi:hypothetical protein [Mangrovicoccus sp. HB161399]|uniref:hypothetical protein n=1 Tax=Mangrovicoccus sp. HB161399 TaxID=2720392 RepID=UPI001555547E|nr:hypothetical protein [Mangrovicoccus sp. HB161399]